MFNEERSLIEHKIKRVARCPVEIGLLCVLISCGGFVNRSRDGSYIPLYGLNNKYGESAVKDAKMKLIEEGVIEEDDNILKINYQPLSDDDWRDTIESLGRILFKHGHEFFRQLISEIISRPEGRYALLELTKGDLSNRASLQQRIVHISKRIGGVYWDDIRHILEGSGLFGRLSPDTYFIFPPFAYYAGLKDDNVSRQLAAIYIAQQINSTFVKEGWCERYCPDYESLYTVGYVEMYRWHEFIMVKTSEAGKQRARAYIGKIIEERRSELEDLFNKQSRMLLWLAKVSSTSRLDRVELIERYPYRKYSCWERDHVCLLSDERIMKKRDEIFHTLIKMGLAVEPVHDYVSTRGGEYRESYYLLAPEIIEFVHKYIGKELEKPLLPAELETKHLLFHIFTDIGYSNDVEYLKHRCEEKGVDVEYALREYNVLKQRYNDNYEMLKSYYKDVREKYFMPIVEYILAG